MVQSVSRALVYSGFGSQQIGGSDLSEAFASARSVFREADHVFGSLGNFRLSDVMFHGTMAQLSQPRIMQPALVTLGSAYTRVLQNEIPGFFESVSHITGHSFGFTTALCAAGVISLPDVADVFAASAHVLETNTDVKAGGMLVVLGPSVSRETVQPVLDTLKSQSLATSCVIANDNAPGQILIAGLKSDLQILIDNAKENRWRCIPFNDGVPAHSPLLMPVQQAISPIVHRAVINPLNNGTHILCSQNVRVVSTSDDIKQALATNFTGPVEWQASVKAMIAGGVKEFVGCGSSVAAGMIGRIDPSVSVVTLQNAADVAQYIARFKEGAAVMVQGFRLPATPVFELQAVAARAPDVA